MAEHVNNHSWLADAQGKLLELRADRQTRIGRAADNDIVLNDITVSQHHAVIFFDGGRAFLRDLGSSNGTFIQGSRVAGGELINGSAVRLGRVSLVYRARVGGYSPAPPVSPVENQGWTGRATPSPRNFFSARTGAVLGVLFLLSLVATLAGRHLFSQSGSSAGHPSFGNLLDSQSYRLPDASSDFVGDWCGWAHVVSCEPEGSCSEDPSPESMGFTSDSGGVAMQYSLMASADTQIENIKVDVIDSRHVRVTSIGKVTDSSGVEVLISDRDDIVSVNSGVVRDTVHTTANINGVSARTEEKSADLTKCSDEFRASEQKYQDEKNMVERGEVKGQIPSK